MNNDLLFITIVDRGMSDRVLNEINALGAGRATVMRGEGSSPNKLLKLLGLDESRKEIVALTTSNDFDEVLHSVMLKEFKLRKKYRGIALSLPLSASGRKGNIESGLRFDPRAFKYQCIFVVLDEGKGVDCISAARNAGAGGATLIRGRGPGMPEEQGIFELISHPDKDVVMIVALSESVSAVRAELMMKLELEKPGHGILFTLPVLRVSGLYENSALPASLRPSGGEGKENQ